jgi:zona occludens toxin
MRGECKCYTQQATLLYMPEGLCKHIVDRGFFVDFKLPRDAPRRSADQPRQEVRPVQPMQQQPPQQLQVVVAPLPQQDPGAAYLQGLSARNAQVRSGLQ